MQDLPHTPRNMRLTIRLTAPLTRFVHQVWAGKGWISTLLLPFSWITAFVVWQKRRRHQRCSQQGHRSRLPVVVVGNILVGGTGKTPVVMAVIQALQTRGWTPGLISRGYGAPASDTPRHGMGQLDPARFGDEPVLIAAQTGVAVAVHRDRTLALQVLEQHYPDVDVVIADDGLQHWALPRDVEIAVQDDRGCGNGRLLPAGPLREPAGRLQTVDFLITQQDADAPLGSYTPAPRAMHATAPEPHPSCTPRAMPVKTVTCVIPSSMILNPAIMHHLASGSRMPFADWRTHYGDAPASAVAGIGVPQRFFHMLRRAGVRLEHTVSLPDHDDYRHPPFAQLPQTPILITPKDAVKCAGLHDNRLWVVHPHAHFSDPGWLEILEGRLRHLRWQRGGDGARDD